MHSLSVFGGHKCNCRKQRSRSPCVSQVQSTGEAVVQGLMGAAVTVSNAETSRAVRAELLLNVSACVFLPNLEDNMEKLLSFIT